MKLSVVPNSIPDEDLEGTLISICKGSGIELEAGESLSAAADSLSVCPSLSLSFCLCLSMSLSLSFFLFLSFL